VRKVPMRKIVVRTAVTCCAAALATSPASAQTGQEVCKVLLAYGTFDSNDTFSDKENFRLVQHLLCRSTITTHQQAVDAQAELNVPIFEVLEFDFGGSVSTATFNTAKESFCQKDYSTASSRERLLVRVRTASQALANAFVDCVTRAQGFFGYVTQGRNKQSFTITLQNNLPGGNDDFEIQKIGYEPTDISCTKAEHLVTPENPILVDDGSTIISCRNLKPEQSFQVAVDTNVGDLGPVELAGLDETLANLTERVDRLEGRAVPAGTIAWFSASGCPSGWSLATELAGRYAVGLSSNGTVGKTVGQALKDGENRPTGRHTHYYQDETVGHRQGRDQYLSGGGSSGLPSVRRRTEVPEGSVDGTNAPYVQLLACRKE
jgi:hypothetical protein